jgi:hypothetical protein
LDLVSATWLEILNTRERKTHSDRSCPVIISLLTPTYISSSTCSMLP